MAASVAVNPGPAGTGFVGGPEAVLSPWPGGGREVAGRWPGGGLRRATPTRPPGGVHPSRRELPHCATPGFIVSPGRGLGRHCDLSERVASPRRVRNGFLAPAGGRALISQVRNVAQRAESSGSRFALPGPGPGPSALHRVRLPAKFCKRGCCHCVLTSRVLSREEQLTPARKADLGHRRRWRRAARPCLGAPFILGSLGPN